YYDLVTGDFEVDGAGLIRHYARKGEDGGSSPLAPRPTPRPNAMPTAGGRTVRPVSDTPKTKRRLAVPSSRTPSQAQAKASAGDRTKAQGKDARSTGTGSGVPPLELTRILFHRSMQGRFGGDETQAAKGESQAKFWGRIQVLKAV